MRIKQKIFSVVSRQFRQPSGVLGWMAGWEMALNPGNRKRNAWAVSLLDLSSDARVLEVGFGPGIAIRELAKRLPDGKVCGIDHSEAMRRFASRRNAAPVRAGRVELSLGSAEDLPEFGQRFDAVITVNSLQFWPEPTERLSEILALLNPGGRIAVVLQPRCPGATAETTSAAAREIERRLRDAGFSKIRTETLDLNPPVACVLATKADG
jgi:ubiquinone/menaquinone biosynthesis C-methylase UbiE